MAHDKPFPLATALAVPIADLETAEWDTLVIVAETTESLTGSLDKDIKAALSDVQKVDKTFSSKVSFVPYGDKKRLIFSPTGPLDRDQDDVRRYSDAAEAGVKRALSAGAKHLCLHVAASHPNKFQKYQLVTLLGAFSALYVPVEVREFTGNNHKVSSLLFLCDNIKAGEKVVKQACSIENGRIVARDIGGSDPERMAAPRVLDYIKSTFPGLTFMNQVMVEKVYCGKDLDEKFPLLAAVNRCAQHVDRHKGKVIKLHYKGGENITKMLYFVGKGITYDTGGADIKTGGAMAGNNRDKCGAAAIAGFFEILDSLKPQGIEAVGWLGMVRNSIGSDCYVADEIIKSTAGVRVRVGNTDAEGRMVMADLLCEAKDDALKADHLKLSPHLITVATLTGHAIRTYGNNYTTVMDNGPARKKRFAQELQKAGDVMGDPFEISCIRREDYDSIAPPTEYEDVLQLSKGPERGHQYPAAFMIKASGLDKHDIDSKEQLSYTHLDIAGSGGIYPKNPTAAPIPALVEQFEIFKLANLE